MSAIPRPASTVVLMDHQTRVYLTKRPETMKFMGGFYVFPGGAVDTSDHVQANQIEIRGERDQSFELAYYVAAARELFEEVGIFLGRKDDGSIVQFDEETEMEYRRLLLKENISFLQILKKEGLHLNLAGLQYFGHIVTPNPSRIRFDTRFFITRLPEGQQPKPDANEISDTLWVSPAEALSKYENNEISLAPPTLHALKTILNHHNGGPIMMPEFKLSDYKLIF